MTYHCKVVCDGKLLARVSLDALPDNGDVLCIGRDLDGREINAHFTVKKKVHSFDFCASDTWPSPPPRKGADPGPPGRAADFTRAYYLLVEPEPFTEIVMKIINAAECLSCGDVRLTNTGDTCPDCTGESDGA